MTAELVPVANMAEIDSLEPAAREVAVTHMLAEARSWLAHAVETTGPQQIAQFKAWVATVAETTRQLNLSKEIQLDAQEMLRRAERGVALAIREGQAEGTVVPPRGYRRGDTALIARVTDFASSDELRGTGTQPGYYDLADGVPESEFDSALTEAKAEGNLSRANVVRKVKGLPSPSTRPEVLRKTRHIDPVRVIRQTVTDLEGGRVTLALIEDADLSALDPRDVDYWRSSLTDSIRSLNRLVRQLKELQP